MTKARRHFGSSTWQTITALFVILAGALACPGQSFQNMDFERPGNPKLAPDGIWITWALAVPGWQHAKGGDSTFVYHNTPPMGALGQYYFLIDESAMNWSPLAGNCSLALVSGYYNRRDTSSPWVPAYIEQTAEIPSDAKFFQLLAKGDFSLSLDSKPLTMSNLGGNNWIADVSQYAGTTATLRVTSLAAELGAPVVVDNLHFTQQPIPEPSSLSLLGLGFAGFLWARRRNRR
jgi:hypothetical protein